MSELIEASRQYLDGGMTNDKYIGCLITYLANYKLEERNS
jgi:hypothetical protein